MNVPFGMDDSWMFLRYRYCSNVHPENALDGRDVIP